MESNAFGKLIRVYRERRGWKQEELAEQWGFTREYVSQIERGSRKLHNPRQVARLADILGITPAELSDVGKKRETPGHSKKSGEDDALLQALLESAHTTIQLSGILLQSGFGLLTDMTRNLHDLEQRLHGVVTSYQGQFRKPALRLLASVHEQLGREAVERTATPEAVAQFQAMYEIAEELGDSDLLTRAALQQAAIWRRRGYVELAFRRLDVAEKHARTASRWISGHLARFTARAFSLYGNEQRFLRSIDRAESIAEDTIITPDARAHNFNFLSVLQEKAQGYTMLGQPEKALLLYEEIDRMRPIRSLREEAGDHIVKAQAYCASDDLEQGIEHAWAGLRTASHLQSSHYCLRIQQMCERLHLTPMGRTHAIRDLHRAIQDIRYQLGSRERGW